MIVSYDKNYEENKEWAEIDVKGGRKSREILPSSLLFFLNLKEIDKSIIT